MNKYDSNWPIFDSFIHILNMKGKIICKEAWIGICNLFKGNNFDINKINKLFNLGNINFMDDLAGITTTNNNSFIKDDKSDFKIFFNILSKNPTEFADVIGNENVIKKIIGFINNNLQMKEYLIEINKYFNGGGNNCCHIFSVKELKTILNCHDLINSGKIDDDTFNGILDLCKFEDYCKLFDSIQLNIQKNLDEHKDNRGNLVQGTLNYKTINRFINESSNNIDINIRNLLSKYSIRDKNSGDWLETIKNLFTKNVQIKIIDEIKSKNLNNLTGLFKYIKDYVDYNVKNINSEENKIDEINKLIYILKGTDFDIKNLFEIIKEAI
jgi:hypothetical protein